MNHDGLRLGIMAGNGILPLDVIEAAKRQGRKVYGVLHRHEAAPELEALCEKVRWVYAGQIGTALNFFIKHHVPEVVFAGGITKNKLYKKFRLDWLGVKVMSRVVTSHDDAILSLVCKAYEDRGVKIVSLSDVLPEYVPSVGVLTSRPPTEREQAAITLGVRAATELGKLDIGQAVVVAKNSIIAVEAVEGTAAMLDRVKALNIKQGVLVKMAKPHQDDRVDLPSIGEQTIESLAAAGGTAIAIEARRSVMLRPDKVVARANELGICIVAVLPI